MPTLTIIGLGPGAPDHLTLQAHTALQQLGTLYLRTRIHPTVAALPPHLTLHTFDHLYEQSDDFTTIYRAIADCLIERLQAGEDVAYAVPGHPLVAEATTRHLLAAAQTQNIAVKVIAGLSFVEPVCTALQIDPLDGGLQLIDALDLLPPPAPAAAGADRAWSELHNIGPYVPPLHPLPVQPTRPALLCQLYGSRIASDVKLSLLERYPADHPITLVRHAGLGDETVVSVPLHELDHQSNLDHLTCAYVPALPIEADVRSFAAVRWVMERLAGPYGCPWDREQTHETLRPFLLEETHEVLEALDANDPDALAEELGDLLLQVVFHAELARQAGTFDMGDVAEAITRKMIRRHPHIFANTVVSDSDEVLQNWEAIKVDEKAAKGIATPASILDGIPVSLPAIATAQKLGQRSAKVGFDWPTVDGVWAKISEEIDELRTAAPDDQTGEVGDLLFAVVNLARWLHVDAESALRQTNAKFRRRFNAIERSAASQNRPLSDLSLDEAEALWQAAKNTEHRADGMLNDE